MTVFQEQPEHRTKHETGPGGSALREKLYSI